jgi:7-keto-8-aminopelargonate synthetase-like enzyme
LIDFLINCARTFIFSTAPGPAAAAAATAGIKLTQSEEGDRRGRLLWQRVAELKSKLGIESSEQSAAIIPIVLGSESRAVEAAKELRSRGLFVPAIRFPTVPRGSARLRVTLTAMHSLADVDSLATAVQALNIPAETLST